MNMKTKFALYFLILGIALLLGGIAHQIIVGISLMEVTDPQVEQFGFMLMFMNLNFPGSGKAISPK